MRPVPVEDVTPAIVGAVDQSGDIILWVLDQPLIPGGASYEHFHPDTPDRIRLTDMAPGDTLWLRDEVMSA